MKISQEVRDYAAENRIDTVDVAVEQGMEEKASEFKEQGSQLYHKV